MENREGSKAKVVNVSFDFAIQVVELYKVLVNHRKEYVMSKQFLRSGTAVGALVRESQNAESKLDFIHKLAIAQKECDETVYWLELLHQTGFIDKVEFEVCSQSAVSLLKLIKRIILTTKENLKTKN
jgi:four helix bundle protein